MIAAAAAEASLPRETTAPRPTQGGGPRIVDIVSGGLQVRLAETAADIDAAQALRYRIFYEIMGARPLPGMAQQHRDYDDYDRVCDHLLVIDAGAAELQDLAGIGDQRGDVVLRG